jgi:hypothetical protein
VDKGKRERLREARRATEAAEASANQERVERWLWENLTAAMQQPAPPAPSMAGPPEAAPRWPFGQALETWGPLRQLPGDACRGRRQR